VPLAFDFFLILMCTWYAFKTRNVPENFNEAKFIGFTMYTTLVIWIAFLVIYFSSEHKITTMCLCVSFSSLFALFLLFLPRCYIMIFKPQKNDRRYFTTTKDVRCHIGYSASGSLRANSSHNSSTNNNNTTTNANANAITVEGSHSFRSSQGAGQASLGRANQRVLDARELEEQQLALLCACGLPNCQLAEACFGSGDYSPPWNRSQEQPDERRAERQPSASTSQCLPAAHPPPRARGPPWSHAASHTRLVLCGSPRAPRPRANSARARGECKTRPRGAVLVFRLVLLRQTVSGEQSICPCGPPRAKLGPICMGAYVSEGAAPASGSSRGSLFLAAASLRPGRACRVASSEAPPPPSLGQNVTTKPKLERRRPKEPAGHSGQLIIIIWPPPTWPEVLRGAPFVRPAPPPPLSVRPCSGLSVSAGPTGPADH